MSPVFAARRRAEEFDSLVEGASTGPVEDARYASLLELVGALRDAPPVEPRPAFSADLRERLMAAAATELAPAAVAAPVHDRLTVTRRSPRERRIAAAVGGFAIVGATTSMAVASQSALPGDVLYPVKRAIENARTGFSVDDGRKGSTLLANASGRLDEVSALATSQEARDVRAIEETLLTFTEQATEASDLLLAAYEADADPSAISELQDFTEQSFATLGDLAAVVPDEVRDSLVTAGNVLAGIEAAVQLVCPDCQEVLTQMPQWLLPTSATSGLQELLPVVPDSTPVATPAPGGGGGKPDAQGGRGDGPGGAGQGGQGGGATSPLQTAPSPGGTPGSGPAVGGGQSGGGTTSDEERQDPVGELIDEVVGGGGGKGDGTGGTGGKGGKNGSVPAGVPDLPLDDVLGGFGRAVDGLSTPRS